MLRSLAFTLMFLLAACGGKAPETVVVPGEYYSADKPLQQAAEGQAEAAPGTPQEPAQQGEVVIGMLVPLSGAQAAIGQQLRDAALLGLYDTLHGLTRMERIRNPQLLIRDSGSGDPKQVQKATQELLESGVKIILGPLMAEDVRVASDITRKAGVPLLSFSNNAEVARPDVYVFGFDPAEQIGRVAGYALAAQIAHYAALAPQSDYGRRVVQQLSRQVAAEGKSLQPVEFFTEGGVPTPMAMQRITKEVIEWGEARKAVFLPLTGDALAEISTALMLNKKINAPYLKLLGTGLWDDPAALTLPALQGAWFATSDPAANDRFREEYQENYEIPPARIAGLGYDAAMLMATLALKQGDEAFTRENLTQKEGFVGLANGRYRLLADGRTQRLLAVVEVAGGQLRVLDAAPQGF